jgi:RNA polymerase-binding transcription factor DksA
MTLTPALRRQLERLIDEEHRRFAAAARAGAEDARIAAQLGAIEGARGRLADGTYGQCVACAADIELDRLIAHPTAFRCLACQQKHERLDPPAGDPA